MAIQKTFCFEALTPSGRVCSVDALSVVFPAEDGQVGVLAGRAPLVAMMGVGRMDIETAEGNELHYFIAGGFAHVRENAMTILAEECTPLDALNAEEAWDELQTARKIKPEDEREEAVRRQLVETARVKFNFIEPFV